MVNAPLPLDFGFFAGIAGAFVCVSVILDVAIFVKFNDFAGGGGFDSVIVGGGFVGTGFGVGVAGGSRLVPTFVPTMTSGLDSMTSGGVGGGRLVLTVGGGASG